MKLRVLIVDDSRFMRLMIRKCIEKITDIEVKEAGNGLEALKTFKNFKPHVVFMDINMPEMDGITALKEIRSFDKDSFVIMVTALEQQSITRDLKSFSNVDFITKPFDCNTLLKLLMSYTKKIM